MIIKCAPPAVVLAALTLNLYAVETKFWQQSDEGDFEKGSFENIALRSDGRMLLAPAVREVFDSSVPYLWTIASDSKGDLFTGGGGTGTGRSKLFAISRGGKARTLAELDGLEIHAIAIDAHDNIFAATDPDGKIYKVSRDGTSQLFYDPHAKYIWAMAFDATGNLFVASGDHGEIHRVLSNGQGSVFFKTEETHARSLAVDRSGNLIVGTEPGGLILRINPSGAGFVLYQAPKREITAVAIGPDGTIYAAGVGTRASAPPPGSPIIVPAPEPAPSPVTATVSVQPSARLLTMAPTPSFTPTSVSGGSDVYRIDPDGSPHKVWNNSTDIVYAIGFDASGHPLFGSGNRGRVYSLDTDVLSTQLLNLAPTQVTSFARTPAGGIYAITGNIGKVYQIGPGLAKSGKFESEALDAGSFAYWGRLALQGANSGIAVRTRSGNVNRPVNNWSPWATVALEAAGDQLSGRVASPSARFLQYEISIDGAAKASHVSSVETAYLTKNVAPEVLEIEITPPNYKFPAPSSTSTTPSTNITLPVLGQRRSASSSVSPDSGGGAQTMNYAKGFIGARWRAHDENGDTLVSLIEIRGRGETDWKLLKDKLKDKEYAWDSTAFPDGEYELRVTISDSPSNPPGGALHSSLISDPFPIDNTPPQIIGLTATSNRQHIEVRWTAKDARSIIDHAEYSINGGEWEVVEPVSHLSDSLEEEYRLVIDRKSAEEQTIAVRVSDYYDNQAVAKTILR